MRRAMTAGLLLLSAAVLMGMCSMCSPLYPINIWDDANCLLTVGRAMQAGKVLYREIYEQKGPLLYLWHMLAAMLCNTSFTGVFLLETFQFFLYLFGIYRFSRRRLEVRPALTCAILTGCGTVCCGAFLRGDSAEEFCLPMAIFLLVLLEEEPTSRRLFLMGLLAGLTALVKYTLLGLFAGACLVLAPQLLRKGYRRQIPAFLAGMLLPVLIAVGWFACKGALKDFFTAYLYNNIMRYAGQGRAGLRELAGMGISNLPWLLPLLAGLLLEKNRRFLGPLAVQALVLLAFGRLWQYSPLILAPFAALGLRAVLERADSTSLRRFCPVLGLSGLVLACLLTPNAFLRFVPLSETAQGRLAARMEEEGTLLQYSHLDDGLYLTSGRLPQEKYFVRLNVKDPEMEASLDGQVLSGECRYVLVSWRPLPERFAQYRLIAYDQGYDDQGQMTKDLFLYERWDEL